MLFGITEVPAFTFLSSAFADVSRRSFWDRQDTLSYILGLRKSRCSIKDYKTWDLFSVNQAQVGYEALVCVWAAGDFYCI